MAEGQPQGRSGLISISSLHEFGKVIGVACIVFPGIIEFNGAANDSAGSHVIRGGRTCSQHVVTNAKARAHVRPARTRSEKTLESGCNAGN